VRLHNHYGPTETHVCTAHTLNGNAAEWSLLPPIGNPSLARRVLLLDEQRNGASEGELYVGGACLADGYFRRADLTAERFRLDLMDAATIARVTLARRRENGCWSISAVWTINSRCAAFASSQERSRRNCRQHPAVRECVVTARDQRLLAYWVGEDVEVHSLRDFLATRLAAHLVPVLYTAWTRCR
jgi:hypothetical protein